MSFYSYKNSGSTHCPCNLSGNEVFSGLNEKICIQVQRVYDSCLMQEQLKEQKVTLLSYGLVPCCNGSCGEQQENANTPLDLDGGRDPQPVCGAPVRQAVLWPGALPDRRAHRHPVYRRGLPGIHRPGHGDGGSRRAALDSG